MEHSISIRRAILHILDTNAGLPVLSDTLLTMPMSISEYVSLHLEKAFKDSAVKRTCFMEPDSDFCESYKAYKNDPETFIAFSQSVANFLYTFMLENVEIPSADLLVMECFIDGEPWLAFLKMNYKHSYIHFVDHDAGQLNDILRQPCALPNENQSLDEFVLIAPEDDTILLKEKKYLIDGRKNYYLSTEILGTVEALSEKESLDIVDKTVKKVITSEYGVDIEKLNQARQTMADDYADDMSLNIEHIAESAFGNDTTVKERFFEEIEERGIKGKKIPVSINLEKKIFRKQKFVTDSGIEITIPTELLNRQDLIEFRNQPDGTISVVLKGIEGLSQR